MAIHKSNPSTRIVKQEIRDQLLLFSFKYLDFSNQKFAIDFSNSNYLSSLISRLKDVNCYTCCDFKTKARKTLRAHRIDWNETSEPCGFPGLNDQMKEEEAWQFSITSNEHGRVHGVIVDNIFYIVWFDPDHNLYP